MTAFDRLDEVRSTARARAVEDFEFFANHVCGAQLGVEVCLQVAQGVEQEQDVEQVRGVFDALPQGLRLHALRAFDAWLFVLGQKDELVHSPSETFDWLFAEEIAA